MEDRSYSTSSGVDGLPCLVHFLTALAGLESRNALVFFLGNTVTKLSSRKVSQ